MSDAAVATSTGFGVTADMLAVNRKKNGRTLRVALDKEQQCNTRAGKDFHLLFTYKDFHEPAVVLEKLELPA